jgi:hypothetical protein
MLVVYNENKYILNENIESELIKNLLEEKNLKEIHLSLYEDVFLRVNKGTLELKEYDEKEIIHLFEGLTYFGCNSLLNVLYKFIFKTNYERLYEEKELETFSAKKAMSLESVHMNYLTSNTLLSELFFERNIDKMEWISSSFNNSLSEDTFELEQETLKELENTDYFYFDKLWKKKHLQK